MNTNNAFQIPVPALNLDLIEEAGREAFRQHGVGGQNRHSYPQRSEERVAFITGHSDEQFSAAMRALDEAAAYHALSLRESQHGIPAHFLKLSSEVRA